jgi:dTDP-4-dehydrorhamnose reductase
MKISVLGHTGYVGSFLVGIGYEPLDCDVTNVESIKDKIRDNSPDFIIYCAAITDIDKCEENPELAMQVNAYGVANVLNNFDGRFIYLSSDHIFKGSSWKKYSENSEVDPQNMYGLSKYAGEVMALTSPKAKVIRTSKLFSIATVYPTLEKLWNNEQVEFTTLIYRSFYYITHFLDGIDYCISNFDKLPNILHIASCNTMSYYDFWLAIADKFGIDKKLIIPRRYKIDAAPRPFKVKLSTSLAQQYGVPIYSTSMGINRLRLEYYFNL